MPETTDIDCKFTTRLEERHGRVIVEIPQQEIKHGTLSAGDLCQISVQTIDDTGSKSSSDDTGSKSSSDDQEPAPPVSEGERRTVKIEDQGEQGDGIARVERGYVVIVPDTKPGDEVTVEVQNVLPNYGFAEVIEDTPKTAVRT